MDSSLKPSRILFALALVALGLIGFVYGDFAVIWQRIPLSNLPARAPLAYLTAAIEVLGGIGLLLPRFAKPASAVLLVFLTLWVVLLRLPAVLAVPSMEATWLGFGEIACILAGGLTLYASLWSEGGQKALMGGNGLRIARVLFAVSLPMIGLSHLVYSEQTAGFVPGWLPYHLAWAYLTGIGNIAAGLGILFGVWPRLAATMEAGMQSVITLLVWGPGLFAVHPDRTALTGFVVSALIALGGWVVADGYRGTAWLSVGKPAWKK